MQKGKHKKNGFFGIILNILITIVFIVILVEVFYIVQIKVLNNSYANIGGYTFFEVATGSMADTINIGDIVVVQITKQVEENEIIVYKENENFITHRLIEKDGDILIAKGDANNSEDKPITTDQILGKVTYIIPQVGVWKDILMSPEILALIFVVIILVGLVLNYTSKTEEKDNE